MVPIGNHDLANALKGMFLYISVGMVDQAKYSILAPQALGNTSAIRIESSKLTQIVHCDTHRNL